MMGKYLKIEKIEKYLKKYLLTILFSIYISVENEHKLYPFFATTFPLKIHMIPYQTIKFSVVSADEGDFADRF